MSNIINNLSNQFREKLVNIKQNHKVDFNWYLYDILSNLIHMDHLIHETDYKDILINNNSFLDIGSADGDLAFFFESLGKNVDIIDLPETNHNGMRGIYFLKKALNSNNNIFELNIDESFKLQKKYDIVFFLGIFYHLKNPLLSLYTLQRYCKYLFLSTRICKYDSNDRYIGDQSLAYFLDKDELNSDSTNWWIFTENALIKTIHRCGYKVLRKYNVGNIEYSNPVSLEKDERIFLLLESI